MEEIKYFETIKCDDYEIFNLDYHNKRIANTIGLNIKLQEYVYPASSDLLRCKVIYNNDEILDVEYFTYKNRDALDKLFEKRDACDEVIIIKNNIVTDTSIANIAIYYENTWITSKNCLLKGTTRDRLINDKILIEKDITVEMLKEATKIALMNAMIDFDIKEDYSLKT